MNSAKIAKEIFEIESMAIKKLSNILTKDFENAVQAVFNSSGKFIISGMGKSGIIGKKIAATLASTGTPSFFLHPGEAYHGDLGMIEKEDILLLISNSGETDEVLKIISFLQNQGNVIISITGNPISTLAKNSDFHLNVHVEKEGCPLNLAPMSSTTATLVMGDALAAALMKIKGFQDQDFAQFHPGGSLGRRLLTTVKDVMHKENLPTCSAKENIKEIVKIISNSQFGLVVVVDGQTIQGIITDGDLRRAMNNEERFFSFSASDIMTKTPKTIDLNLKLTQAQEVMAKEKVNSLLVTENDNLVGIVQIYDLGL